MVAQGLEKAVRAYLRKQKCATTKQILDSVGETYPPASKFRVRRILNDSNFAKTRVRAINVNGKTGPYRKRTSAWVYKSTRKPKAIQAPPEERSLDMNVLWPRLVYRSRLGDEVKHIREELNDLSILKAIGYNVWIEKKPEEKRRLIGNNEEYEAIQDFITALDARNDYQRDKTYPDETYRELTRKCIKAYEIIRKTSFLKESSHNPAASTPNGQIQMSKIAEQN